MSIINGFSVKPATIIEKFGSSSDVNKGSTSAVRDLIKSNSITCFIELWDFYINADKKLKEIIQDYLICNAVWYEYDEDPELESIDSAHAKIARTALQEYAFSNPKSIRSDTKYMNSMNKWNSHLFITEAEIKQNAETLSDSLKELEDSIVVSVGQDRSGRAAAMGMKQHNKSAEDLAKSIISIIEMDMDKSDILNSVNKAFGYPLGEEIDFSKMSNEDLKQNIINMIPSEEIMNKAIEDNHTKVYGWIFDSLIMLAKQVKMADADADIMAIVADTIISVLEKAKNDHFNDFAIICDRIRTKVIKYAEENIPTADDNQKAEILIGIISDVEEKIDEVISDSNVISMAMAQKEPSEIAKSALDIVTGLSYLVPLKKSLVIDLIDSEKASKFISMFPSKAGLLKAFKNPTLKDYAWLAEDIYDALDKIAVSKTDDEIIGVVTSTLIKMIENARVKHMSDFISICTKIKNRIAKAKAKAKDFGMSAEDLNDITGVAVNKPAPAAAMKQVHIPDEDDNFNLLNNVIKTFVPQKPEFIKQAMEAAAPAVQKSEPKPVVKLSMDQIPEHAREYLERYPWIKDIMDIAYKYELFVVPYDNKNQSGAIDCFTFVTRDINGVEDPQRSFAIDCGTIIDRRFAMWHNVTLDANTGRVVFVPFENCETAYKITANNTDKIKIDRKFFDTLFRVGFIGLNKSDTDGKTIYTSNHIETNRVITMITRSAMKDYTAKDGHKFYTNCAIKAANIIRGMINEGKLPRNIRFNIVDGEVNKWMIISSEGAFYNFRYNDTAVTGNIMFRITMNYDENGNVKLDNKGNALVLVSQIVPNTDASQNQQPREEVAQPQVAQQPVMGSVPAQGMPNPNLNPNMMGQTQQMGSVPAQGMPNPNMMGQVPGSSQGYGRPQVQGYPMNHNANVRLANDDDGTTPTWMNP